MLSLVRSGPESLVLLANEKITAIRKHLDDWGSHVLLTPEQALRIYGNNRRLIFFEPVSPLLTEEEGELETYVSENTLDHILCTMINNRLISGIQEVRLLPGYITMRLLGQPSERHRIYTQGPWRPDHKQGPDVPQVTYPALQP